MFVTSEAAMHSVVTAWLALPIAAMLAQFPESTYEWRTGVWWKDCELDTRYDRAYGWTTTFGEPNPSWPARNRKDARSA